MGGYTGVIASEVSALPKRHDRKSLCCHPEAGADKRFCKVVCVYHGDAENFRPAGTEIFQLVFGVNDDFTALSPLYSIDFQTCTTFHNSFGTLWCIFQQKTN